MTQPTTGEIVTLKHTRSATPAIPRWKTATIGATLALAVTTGVGLERFVLVGTAVGGQQHEELEDTEAFEVLAAAYDVVREHYILNDDMSDEELVYGAAQGMLDALNDADHSYFMDPDATERNESSLASQLVGIGVVVDWESTPPRIIFPINETPAFDAGILPGDIIISVDGVDLATINDEEEITTILRGEAGTEVTLVLLHPGETEPYEVTITREAMVVNPVSWTLLPGDILWVRLNGFPEDAAMRMTEALQAGKDAGARGVLLDLRGNSGGWIQEAIDIASQFEPDGSVVFNEEHADGTSTVYVTTGDDGAWQDQPLLVLVDGDTASSGELLAATLKDNERALLVGATTLGLGTSVRFFDLPDGTSMALSTDLWTTPDGDVMLNAGITPDIEVQNPPGAGFALPYILGAGEPTEDDIDTSNDRQLQVGYDLLLKLVEDEGA